MRPFSIAIFRALFIAIFCLSHAAIAAEQVPTPNKALAKTHIKITQNYETVQHIKARDVATMKQASYLIFDIREEKEYAVSHIQNAIWVDPSITASEFYEHFGPQAKHKTIILYCSVGVRSSRLAERLMAGKSENQVVQIYNLESGIFGWHNESRPLVHAGDSTNYVHPYNRIWGRMVNRKTLRRYK